MTHREARLEVQGLGHDFGNGRGLKHLDLKVGAGEIVGLLGPNGSGKSTALALLAGLLPLGTAAGCLRVGTAAYALRSREFRARLGVVFQHPSLDRKLTARENLELSLRSHGWGKAASRARSIELLRAEGLAERADEVIDGFSGGMRRRVDLLRALAHRPSLLLMDEPSAGLDERSFRSLWESVNGLRTREGVAVLVATHRPEEAARCDRLVILASGAVVAGGTPADLVSGLSADLLTLELRDAAQAESVVERLRAELALEARVSGASLEIPCEQGPSRLVEVVELMGQGTFESISVRRPSLADVFVELSGARLDEDETSGADHSSTGGADKRSRKRKKAAA